MCKILSCKSWKVKVGDSLELLLPNFLSRWEDIFELDSMPNYELRIQMWINRTAKQVTMLLSHVCQGFLDISLETEVLL